MRLHTFSLALISAFFIPKAFSNAPDGFPSTHVWPGEIAKAKVLQVMKCWMSNAPSNKHEIKTDQGGVGALCKAWGNSQQPSDGCSYWSNSDVSESAGAGGSISYNTYKPDGVSSCQGGISMSYQRYPDEQLDKVCPPDDYPLHTFGWPTGGVPDTCHMVKEEEPELDPDCPEPTDNDPFSFAVGGSGSVCFPAADGRQCEIQTDSNGGYNIPVSYGSTEPVSCVPDPEPEPEEPEEPENPDDPEPTPDPDAPKTPDDADDTDKDNSLDGINQINDNLKVINDNMNVGIESHTERLDRMAKETQNSNELLATIKSNTLNVSEGIKETTDVIRDQIKETTEVVTAVGVTTDEIKKGNTESTKQTTLLEGIKENTKTESISITSSRKKGGLNDIFSADDLAQVTAEIETKKTELTEYIETIKSESETILDLDPNISGSYTDHKEIIKGVEVDMGIGRFSSFYQMIAPAIILIASISALFIILGGNKE